MSSDASIGTFLTVPELARLTGFDVRAIRGHLERREWPGLRVGNPGVWRIHRCVLECLNAGNDPRTLVSTSTQGTTA